MPAKAKRDFALASIYENIANLRLSAFQAYRNRNFAISTHLAIICGEECAKYLLVFCREYLPKDIFKKRYSHAPKYRVLGVPWHLSGALSVVYVIVAAKREGFLGGNADNQRLVVEDLLRFVGNGKPERIAETILECLEPYADERREISLHKEMKQREKHRQAVYVDLDENYQIAGRPQDVDRDVAKRYLRDTTVALAAINFVISEKPDVEEYVSALPRDLRDRNRKDATDLVAKIRASAESERKIS
jgi:hypothetical protein